MKRKYVSLFLLITFVLSVYATENTESIYNHYFSYPGIQNGIDPQTGNTEEAPASFYNFFNREKLKMVEITRLQYGQGKLDQFIRQEYLNGLIISEYSDYYEKSFDVYKYDSLRRIIQEGGLWTYKYFDDIPNKQEAYNKDTLSKINIITLLPDGFEIESIASNGVKRRRRTIKENGLIIKVVESREERERAWYDFSYENGLLNKIVSAMASKDDIRSITTVKEYDGNNIVELERISYRNEQVDFTDVYYLSDYDTYGNWHTSEQYRDGKLISRVERKIEYIE